MMEISSLPLFNDVLDVIHTVNHTLDRDLIRRKILDVFIKTFEGYGGVFFLPKADSKLPDIIIENLDEEYSNYFKDYYHQFDPLNLMDKSSRHVISGPTSLRISYDAMRSTEYYNDFLKPQQIHYKLVVNLKTLEGLQGKIVLTRPAGSRHFSKTDIKLAHMLSAHMAQALSLNELRRRISLNSNILDCIEDDLSTGILLIDESMHLVYMNQKAKALCGKAFGSIGDTDEGCTIHPDLHMAIRELIDRTHRRGQCAGGLPHYKTPAGNNGVYFSAYAKYLRNGPTPDCCNYYMIYISESNANTNIAGDETKQRFRLTRREMEVMGQIFKGYKNSEIAKALFISEITVKKHIQKIYSKVGVKNRTSLMNKILSHQTQSHLSH
jgi:DNA-binding CsgD family transcriptional regulator